MSKVDEVKSHVFLDTEMEEGFRNWNNDDGRAEGLGRRMKYDRLLEGRWKKQSKDRQIKLYSEVER
jgi:hypothetical protein